MTRNLQLNKNEFVSNYLAYKRDGKTDKEISKLMFISKNTLYRYKKVCDLPVTHVSKMRKRVNDNGVSIEMFDQARQIGLCPHTVNKRIRGYGWTVEDAISIPPLPREKRRKWKQL